MHPDFPNYAASSTAWCRSVLSCRVAQRRLLRLCMYAYAYTTCSTSVHGQGSTNASWHRTANPWASTLAMNKENVRPNRPLGLCISHTMIFFCWLQPSYIPLHDAQHFVPSSRCVVRVFHNHSRTCCIPQVCPRRPGCLPELPVSIIRYLVVRYMVRVHVEVVINREIGTLAAVKCLFFG